MCECYQIGGPFIAEDPDCPVHGRDAQYQEAQREIVIQRCQLALSCGTPEEVYRALQTTTEYLQGL